MKNENFCFHYLAWHVFLNKHTTYIIEMYIQQYAALNLCNVVGYAISSCIRYSNDLKNMISLKGVRIKLRSRNYFNSYFHVNLVICTRKILNMKLHVNTSNLEKNFRQMFKKPYQSMEHILSVAC